MRNAGYEMRIFVFLRQIHFLLMKRAFLTLFLVLCLGMTFGQNRELHQVIVVMEKQYDNVEMSRKTQFMDKAQRRDFVIHEHQAFCQVSQAEVLDFAASLGEEVQEVKPFWSVNAFSCMATDDAVHQLVARRDVAYVYNDEPRKMLPDFGEAQAMNTRDNAWHVDKVNAPAVWNYNGSTGYTGNGVVVAILDSGVNYNHLDIAGSMWNGGPEFPHHGYDVINHDNDPMDDHGHGTHCAGIVAGQGNAGTQTGVAPGAQIMAVKLMDDTGYGGDEQLIEGIEFALAHGADILSCSFGDAGTGGYALYRQLYETVLDAGVIAAVAAGNDGDTQYAIPKPYNIESPGNCPPPWFHPDQTLHGGHTAVVCVGATDATDKHSSFSSVGPVTWAEGELIGDYTDYPYEIGNPDMMGLIRPDISAPGSSITSLNYASNNGYVAYDGTSMATPCVAGVMALMLEADPSLNPAQIDSIIELTAVKIGNFKKNNTTGSGRIDALAAVNALFYHGPTGLTANFDGTTVTLNWEAPALASTYEVYRDGLRIANNLTATTYTDHLNYGGNYTYYVTAVFGNNLSSLPSNYVFIEKAVDIDAEIINNQRVELRWNMPNSIVDGFESGDFYQNMWFNDATSPWVISTSNPSEGTYCAKSTNTGMFSTSSLSLGVNVPVTCVISYEARISCFPLNGGGFLIDNVQQGETIKDEVPWTRYSFTLAPGNHQLEWKYVNQLTEGEYENAFYIDDITVGNPFNVYRDDCTGSSPELIAEKVADAHYVDYGWDALPIGQYKYGISNDNGLSIAWSECLPKNVMAVNENQEVVGIRRITIINALGQIVYEANTSIDNSVTLLEKFPQGIYVVNLLTDDGMVSKKVCR
jgi:subtilisin family serine protease